MTDYRHVRSERLCLDALTERDAAEVFPLTSDPDVWRHFPSGRHTSVEQTAAQLATFEAAWERTGLGYWAARDADGHLLGVGGCALRDQLTWNVYYRFAPAAQGQGYASELVATARAAAADVRPDVPVVAFMLEHNEASRRTAERAGLTLAWRGPDAGNDDPDAVRLVFADRELTPDQLAQIVQR